jgi:hypothetical protein
MFALARLAEVRRLRLKNNNYRSEVRDLTNRTEDRIRNRFSVLSFLLYEELKQRVP